MPLFSLIVVIFWEEATWVRFKYQFSILLLILFYEKSPSRREFQLNQGIMEDKDKNLKDSE